MPLCLPAVYFFNIGSAPLLLLPTCIHTLARFILPEVIPFEVKKVLTFSSALCTVALYHKRVLDVGMVRVGPLELLKTVIAWSETAIPRISFQDFLMVATLLFHLVRTLTLLLLNVLSDVNVPLILVCTRRHLNHRPMLTAACFKPTPLLNPMSLS